MKLQTLLLASVVFAQTALAQTPSSAPVGLPAGSKLSPAAKRAEEAPTWTPGPAPAAAQPRAAESAVPVMASNPAAIPGTIVPATIPNTPSAVAPAAALDPNSIVAPSALNAFGSAPNSAGSTAAAP